MNSAGQSADQRTPGRGSTSRANAPLAGLRRGGVCGEGRRPELRRTGKGHVTGRCHVTGRRRPGRSRAPGSAGSRVPAARGRSRGEIPARRPSARREVSARWLPCQVASQQQKWPHAGSKFLKKRQEGLKMAVLGAGGGCGGASAVPCGVFFFFRFIPERERRREGARE